MAYGIRIPHARIRIAHTLKTHDIADKRAIWWWNDTRDSIKRQYKWYNLTITNEYIRKLYCQHLADLIYGRQNSISTAAYAQISIDCIDSTVHIACFESASIRKEDINIVWKESNSLCKYNPRPRSTCIVNEHHTKWQILDEIACHVEPNANIRFSLQILNQSTQYYTHTLYHLQQ